MKRMADLLSLGLLLGAVLVLVTGLPVWAQTDPEPPPEAEDDPFAEWEEPDTEGAPEGEPVAPAEPPAPDEPIPEGEPGPAASPDAPPTEAPEPPPGEQKGAPPTEAPGPPPAKKEAEEEIVITGSRIKRTVFSSTAPVAVMEREDIDRSGAHNTEDLVQNLTVAIGSGFKGGNLGESQGTAQVNLRGLGAGATLVLLNGRRTVPSAAGVTVPFTDISTIPLTVVERIEVHKGGASAIYGTDAIAGVINIITRKDWEGMKVQVDGRADTQGFDYREGTASAAIGASGDTARVIAGLQYHRSTELMSADRDFTWEEGPPGGQGGNRSLIGQPGPYIVGGALQPDPDCAAAPGSRVEDNGFCSFSFNEFWSLTPNLERVSLYTLGEYDFSDYTNVFIEANVAKTRAENSSSPSFRVLGNPTIPADHVDNPFGTDVSFVGRPLGAAAGGVTQSHDEDTLRTAIGLEGDFEGLAPDSVFEDWGWELVTTFGVSRYSRFYPDELGEEFAAAVNSCSDPGDLSGCFNPFYSAVLGTGTPNSDAVINSFTSSHMNDIDQHLQTYGGGLDGSLFELPGGDLGFAVGAEVRREQRSAQHGHDSNQFDLEFYFGDDDAYADRDVLAGYLELLWPFVQGLELQTAGRIERYSEGWTTVNPLAGILLNPGEMAGSDSQPLTGLRLRGSFSRAFRAPGLYQSFDGATTIPFSIDTGGVAPVYVPVRRQGNPDLEPETATVFSAGLGWEPFDALMLEADYWNYTYQDYIAPVNAQGLVDGCLPDLEDCSELQLGPTGILERVTVLHVNQPDDITTHGIDAAARVRAKTEGAGTFTLGADSTFMLAYRISAALVPDVGEEGEEAPPPFCDAESCDVSGNFNEFNIAGPLPSWRLNLPLTWELEEHLVGYVLHLTSPLEDWAPTRYDASAGEPRSIDAFVTMDLQYQLTLGDFIGKETRLRLGVINLLDQAPPFVDVMYSYAMQLHDPRGRMVYATLTQELL